HILAQKDHYTAQIMPLDSAEIDERESEIMVRSLLSQFEQYAKLHKKIPPEFLSSLSSIDDPGRIADSIASQLAIKIEDKQQILDLVDLKERFGHLAKLLESEIELLNVEKKIRGRVKSQMEKSQREYYLNEQMKAIQRELGEEETPNEIEEMAKHIKECGMPKDVLKKASAELNKLKMMAPISAEATVVRNYIEWLTNVPWKSRSQTSNDLALAQKVLDEDHYALEKVKERILEHLAVQQRVKKIKGPILCLVGPPGVGKTSLGRSIARATKRSFARISLGGVRDEAEIRGHRRTYIGALPGKIIQCMAKSGKKNPLLLLDEIDKMVADFRGDPASAMLEVLDPEQNHTFNDHYMEVDYDLSEVMFVTTANSINIPPPLLDRMEVIRLSGYTEDEKVHIATKYLIPKQVKANGLKKNEIEIPEKVVKDIVRYYTREAGVRSLEREIANICRKTVKSILISKKENKELPSSTSKKLVRISVASLAKLIGVKKYRYGQAEQHNRIGQVVGLAWTETGGDLLTIEATAVKGKGKAFHTGKLGDVMKESIQAAMTVVRSRGEMLGIDANFFQENDFHIHVPEGAIPKDGPSAGVAMVTAIVSALTSIPVRASVAMTGEITLRGEVLPIGGLKEKLLAALRGGITTVLIPEENAKELVEIPKNIKKHIDIQPVRWIDQVLEVALQEPLPQKGGSKDNNDNLLVAAPSTPNTSSKEPPSPPSH
ncbi:MAG: endopeptidase La, partial [Candidatus Porifericomitaceae bacterium WSBS_2022_MAG_OTU9]